MSERHENVLERVGRGEAVEPTPCRLHNRAEFPVQRGFVFAFGPR